MAVDLQYRCPLWHLSGARREVYRYSLEPGRQIGIYDWGPEMPVEEI
jgi:hypothetical protein